MKGLLMTAGLVLFGAIVLLGVVRQSHPAATYVDHDKVAAGGQLVAGPDFSVSILKRTAAGQVEIHEKETDIFYIMDGEATFVTDGTMVGGRVSRPNQQLGTDIQGGKVHHLVKGDVITIPAGVPHWFKEIIKPVTYHTVKVIKP